MQIDTTISFDSSGEVSVRERGEQDTPHGAYSSTSLLKIADHQTDLALYCDPDQYGDGVLVTMGSYHATNPDTGRTFHCNQDVLLDWQQVQQVQRFLQFILDCKSHT